MIQNYFFPKAIVPHTSKLHSILEIAMNAGSIIYIAICVSGVVLNSGEIVLLLHAKRTKLPFDIALISLAASDLITSLALSIVIITQEIKTINGALIWIIKLYVLVLIGSGISSAFHMIFIAVQRLVAVLYPLNLSIWITRKRSTITICLMWATSAAATVPIYGNGQNMRFLAYSSFIFAGAIILCYAMINYKIITRRQLSVTVNSTQNLQVLFHSICVTAIFFGCTLTFSIAQLINSPDMIFYGIYVYILQVVLNPIAYFFFKFLKERASLPFGRLCCIRSVSVQEQCRCHTSQGV